jgi:hypothetical protein
MWLDSARSAKATMTTSSPTETEMLHITQKHDFAADREAALVATEFNTRKALRQYRMVLKCTPSLPKSKKTCVPSIDTPYSTKTISNFKLAYDVDG